MIGGKFRVATSAIAQEELLKGLETLLVAPLPEEYRAFLLEDNPTPPQGSPAHGFVPLHFRPSEAPYHFAHALRPFLREWDPLGGVLAPVEYLGEGLFACLHLCSQRSPTKPPVVLWEICADLSEQTLLPLAPDWLTYRRSRGEGIDPLGEAAALRYSRKRIAQRELAQAIAGFNRFSEWFHQKYSLDNGGKEFGHHLLNRLPRYDDWRPERFCVHDHLLGVMGYHVNRLAGRIEVTGLATRDHTNYARGSATRALLLGLLCEWAKQSCTGGIVFIPEWDVSESAPVPIPYEIALYGHLLGVDLKPDDREISYENCQKLFLRLTPFREEVRSELQSSGLAVKACLMAHKGVWSISQIEDLLWFCPFTQELFQGSIVPEEQIRMALLLEHARMAMMAGMAEQMIRAQAEEEEKSVILLSEGLVGRELAYSRRLVCNFKARLACMVSGEKTMIEIPEGVPFLLAAWPVEGRDFARYLPSQVERLAQGIAANGWDPQWAFLLLPEQSAGLSKHLPPKDLPVRLALLGETFETINLEALKRLQQAARMRS